jgi:hypothetical protein
MKNGSRLISFKVTGRVTARGPSKIQGILGVRFADGCSLLEGFS